ncbi:hypothetical protein TWF569_011954 [Orbilia oligospora]|nr:hypothetical protein TWF569_011954 [Orbilia oligospora]
MKIVDVCSRISSKLHSQCGAKLGGNEQVEHVFQLHTGLVRQAAFGAQIRIRLHPPVTAKILFVDASHCRNSFFSFKKKIFANPWPFSGGHVSVGQHATICSKMRIFENQINKIRILSLLLPD